MHKGFFAEALATRPLLWQAMLRANASFTFSAPAYMAEASRILGPSAIRLQQWLTEGQCSSSRREPAPEGTDFWDYAEESRRLALLDRSTVKALMRITGVALHATEAARVILAEEQLILRRQLGETMYAYALYRGQYQLGNVRRFFACLHAGLPLSQRCTLHGNMALRLVAVLWPESLQQRFIPHLPLLPEGESLPALEEDEIREVWLAVKKLLLREVDPVWAPSFN
ncbi:MAG: hypothetical protein IJD16_06660 [Desulfovibrio sp.]|nr:hypothetical protein [Desulfovibrio sp.]